MRDKQSKISIYDKYMYTVNITDRSVWGPHIDASFFFFTQYFKEKRCNFTEKSVKFTEKAQILQKTRKFTDKSVNLAEESV